ncbi:hypothetical protein LWI28_003932 [Acer negundo]|uniref:CRAL-TRIO domain-containing protein n=1 Tax=Acer negundo TaxID=4023 RepID=A0AAD5NRC7_ACENE|nr:hypothetical protein LWI28_003932 [Acer negundo]
MFLKYLKWRRSFDPNGSISPSEIPNEIAQNNMFLQGFNKKGRPIGVAFGARHFQNKRNPEEFKLYLLDKLCEKMGAGQEKFVVIGDLQGWGYSNSDINPINFAAPPIFTVILRRRKTDPFVRNFFVRTEPLAESNLVPQDPISAIHPPCIYARDVTSAMGFGLCRSKMMNGIVALHSPPMRKDAAEKNGTLLRSAGCVGSRITSALLRERVRARYQLPPPLGPSNSTTHPRRRGRSTVGGGATTATRRATSDEKQRQTRSEDGKCTATTVTRREEEDGGNPPVPQRLFASGVTLHFIVVAPPPVANLPFLLLLGWVVELDGLLDEVSKFNWFGCNTQHMLNAALAQDSRVKRDSAAQKEASFSGHFSVSFQND